MRFALGIDIGGTFTDIVLLGLDEAEMTTHKELTTHDDPSEGVLRGVDFVLERAGVQPGQIDRIVHATTLFTNALIERRGACTGLITTEGFADTLEMGRENKYDLYDVRVHRPPPIVPRHLRIGVPERISPGGTVSTRLDEEAVAGAVRQLLAEGVTSIAISFLHAYANPAHEQRAAAIAREIGGPDLAITLSSEVAPEIREFERTCTAAVNAYIKPIARRYLDAMVERFAACGINAPLHLMLSNGGLSHIEEAKRAPVQLLESGPAAGALSVAHFGATDSDGDLMAFDMGGTTAKLCLIEDNEPAVAFRFEAARQERFAAGSGLPILISTVELIEIGAGGGSIARCDDLGLLKVGPASAGSMPGPAAYGRGGTDPTVTDADFVLGYLDPARFADGTVPIDLDASRSALEKLGNDLGIGMLKAACGIHDIVNENMAGAARVHFAERGRDPGGFALMATGGAGPVHAYSVARKLNMTKLICPPSAGVASALGLLVAPARADRTMTIALKTDDMDPAVLEQRFRTLEADAMAVIEETRLSAGQIRKLRFADGRFIGQGFTLTVALPEGPYDMKDRDAVIAEMIAAFTSVYREKFGHAPPNIPVEFINIRVSVQAFQDALPEFERSSGGNDAGPAVRGSRMAWFSEAADYVETTVYDWSRLAPGMRLDGPALIEDAGSTLVIGPDGFASIGLSGNIVVEIKAAADRDSGAARHAEPAQA
ncbi:MAG: hydantoinase/oxoprolinase family protein [Salinarimonas sp.]